MHFNTAENEPSSMNIIRHPVRQTEAQRTSQDKFCFKATLLAQDTFTFPNTTCIQQFMKPASLSNEKFQFKTALQRFLNTQAF
jgi:hypothetical protein